MKKIIGVIGAGITGAVISRIAAELNWEVDVYEKRPHVGGNCYDKKEFGSFTHQYGPHLFHTSNKKVVDFLSQFCEFTPYFHKVNAHIDGDYVPIPFCLSSLFRTHPYHYAKKISEKLIENFGYGSQTTIYALLNSNDIDLRSLGEFIYKKVFEGYSKKQWGIKDPMELDKSVLNRIPVRVNNNTDYFVDKYQYLPKHGYTQLIGNILNHESINVICNKNIEINHEMFAEEKSPSEINNKTYKHIFYCGMIDQFFNFSDGQLSYRSLSFKKDILPINKLCRPSLVTNYPSNFDFTRISDFSYIAENSGSAVKEGVVFTEFSGEYDKDSEKFNEPFYPFFTESSKIDYERYNSKLSDLFNISFCGRLAKYKYFDMDDAVAAAFGEIKRCEWLRD